MSALDSSLAPTPSVSSNMTADSRGIDGSSKRVDMPQRHRKIRIRLEDEREAFLEKFGMGRAYLQQSTLALSPNVINPDAPWLVYWTLLVSSAIAYNLVLLVARAAFTQLQQDFVPLWLTLDYIADAVYIADMLVRSRTCFYVDGNLVTSRAQLLRSYLQSWSFAIDCCSIMPTDLLYLVTPEGVDLVVVRFNRLLRAGHLIKFVRLVEARSTYPNMTKLAFLLGEVCLISHWNCCLYFWISSSIGLGSDKFVYQPSYVVSKTNASTWNLLSNQYGFSLFWSFMVLTSIVHVPEPHTDAEFGFLVAEVLFSVVLFASIVGNVGVAIESIGEWLEEMQEQVASIREYLLSHRVEKRLEEKVLRLLEHAHMHSTMNEEAVASILPRNLQTEIAINVHYESLKQVALFQECESGLLAELMVRLKLELFSPGDFVCRKGHVGRHMYIVKTGKLQVVNSDATQVLATLSPGAVFGEISLLNISGNKNGNRRTANVCSVGFSELLSLSCDDLWSVLDDYPDAKSKLINRGVAILRQSKSLDDDFVALQKKTAALVAEESGKLLAKLVILDQQMLCLRETSRLVNARFKERAEKVRREVLCRRAVLHWCNRSRNSHRHFN